MVLLAAVAGSGLLGFVGLLRENEKFGQYGQTVFDLTLWFVGAGIAAATVVAWFHGERGRQQTNVLEWILLSLIAVVWLTGEPIVSGLPILHTCGHRKLHTWRFDLAGGRVGM